MVEVGRKRGAIGALCGIAAVAAAGMFALSLPHRAAAQEPSPVVNPTEHEPPIEGKPAPAYTSPLDITADFHVESTVLGFDQGIGPAVGRELTYNGKLYQVADVFTADGKPCFSGGSRFTIAPAGGRLVIGLKMSDPAVVSVASLK
ncbi:MAG: hypothetical protein JSR47_22615 [Proteobacteria bacterium]|nr:hypothetical protein [Pseudomonadota bacterium]